MNSNVHHVYPEGDLKEHVTNEYPARQYWCNPEIEDVEGGGTVVIHNSMDRREEYENGRKSS